MVPVMEEVDVRLVLDGGMAAALAVLVGVRLMVHVGELTLVPVTLMGGVSVPVMNVVGVALMGDRGVAAAGAMGMGMVGMHRVGDGHLCNSSEWRTASVAMWARWASVSE